MLDQWRQDPIPGRDIGEVRLDVIELWSARFEDARRADEQLGKIASVMREANLGRYRAARENIDAAMASSLLEAQFAAVERDPVDGADRFETWFLQCEERGANRLAELLIRSFLKDLDTVPDEITRTRLAAWAAYYRARLATTRADLPNATVFLEQAKAKAVDDERLTAWMESLETRIRRDSAERVDTDLRGRGLAVSFQVHTAEAKKEHPFSTRGFLRFWTSMPGVLTAAAAVILVVGSISFASMDAKNASTSRAALSADPAGSVGPDVSSFTCSNGSVVRSASDCPTPSTTPSKTSSYGRIYGDNGKSVPVLDSPSVNGSVLGTYADGTLVEIECTTEGDAVQRADGRTSSLWDRTPYGYIPDMYINTGTNDPTMPDCLLVPG